MTAFSARSLLISGFPKTLTHLRTVLPLYFRGSYRRLTAIQLLLSVDASASFRCNSATMGGCPCFEILSSATLYLVVPSVSDTAGCSSNHANATTLPVSCTRYPAQASIIFRRFSNTSERA